MTRLLLCCVFLFPAIGLADEWTTQDSKLETAYFSLALVDWRQTQDISRHSELQEVNPILGKHPSNGKINSYFLCATITHFVISSYLPREYRTTWQESSILFEFAVVGHNARLGLGFFF